MDYVIGFHGWFSFLASLVAYLPMTMYSLYTIHKKQVASQMNLVLFTLMIITIFLPMKDAISLSTSLWKPIVRVSCAGIIYSCLVQLYRWHNKKIPPKYGLVVSVNMIYILFAQFTSGMVMFGIQLMILLFLFYRQHRQTIPIDQEEEEEEEETSMDEENASVSSVQGKKE